MDVARATTSPTSPSPTASERSLGRGHLPGQGAQGQPLAIVIEQPQPRHAGAEQLDGGADDALEHLVAGQRGGQPLRQPRQCLEPSALLLGLGQQGGAGDREAHLVGDALQQREQIGVEGPRPRGHHRQHAPHVIVDEDRQRQLGVKFTGLDGAAEQRVADALGAREVGDHEAPELRGLAGVRGVHAPLAQPLGLLRRQPTAGDAG